MKVLCRNCGHIGSPQRKLKGHILITLILLICWLVPGIIYMIWRRTGLKDSCSKCGSEMVVPANSPAAAAFAHEAATPETHVRCPDCRELVRKDASKCKHCGTALVPQ